MGEKQWEYDRREKRKSEIKELRELIEMCWENVKALPGSALGKLIKKQIRKTLKDEQDRYKTESADKYREIAKHFEYEPIIEDYAAYLVLNDAYENLNVLGEILKIPHQAESIEPFNMNTIMYSHIYHFIGKQALRYIEQETEIRNSIAYNKALLRRNIPDLEAARSQSLLALKRIITISRPSDYARGRNMTFKERKAQYYDTLAWIYYGIGQLSFVEHEREIQLSNNVSNADHQQTQTDSALETAPSTDNKSQKKKSTQRKEYWELARKLLTENSLETYHSVSVSYYHLVRLQADLLDEVWDNMVQDGDGTFQQAEINAYIQQLIRNWRIAEKSDVNGRLYEQLRIVRQRIDTYQAQWKEVRYNTVR